MENLFKNKSIKEIRGIKDARSAAFARLGVYTIGDLLTLYPVRYENRSITKKICELREDDEVSICGIVQKIKKNIFRKNLTLYTVTVYDGTGSINLLFYNQKYIHMLLQVSECYVFYGKVTKGYGGRLEMNTPVFDSATEPKNMSEFMRIKPVYPLTVGLTQNNIRNAVEIALDMKETAITNGDAYEIPEIPGEIRHKYNFMTRAKAEKAIHLPEDIDEGRLARERIAFDELLELQLMLYSMKSNCSENRNTGIKFSSYDISNFLATLPFKLTDAQIDVWNDIERDMESKKIMNRLVIGDVGSGKTIVAVLAMLKAIKSGFQAVYMAPTEILAEQHYKNICGFLKPFGINVGLLTGSATQKGKKDIKDQLAAGKIHCIIGTHALIQDDVIFQNAGIVITDEQHRFGVRQRAILSMQKTTPDILVMTATPIPRTLALILYGDMDISAIKSLPKGRIPIKTYKVDSSMHERIYIWIRKLAEQGQQAYIVHPLVESEEVIESALLSATENYEKLSNTVFKGISCGLLHGKMKNIEKDEVMQKFADGEIKILFTTTVVEVGVDVANATVIAIENAERFGLAQLHQLRGRVGRGNLESHCVLITDNKGNLVKKRMDIMTSGCDGFAISEKDLELRGPGDFFGTAQHGIPSFKAANLYEDIDLLQMAQNAANEIVNEVSSSNPKEEYRNYMNYIESKNINTVQL